MSLDELEVLPAAEDTARELLSETTDAGRNDELVLLRSSIGIGIQ